MDVYNAGVSEDFMTNAEQKKAAQAFAEKWAGKGDEKQDSQKFWIELLQKVYGVEDPTGLLDFEKKIQLGHTSFVDITIPATHVIIEQKSLGKDLEKPIKQSDGTFLTPYQQAKRYAAEFKYSERPRWIVTCNFGEFNIYDLDDSQVKREVLYLKDLPKEFYRLQFLVNIQAHNTKKEMDLSMQAGEIVGKLYNALHAQYKDPDDPAVMQSLNKLCVRIVFLLYAEDAGILGKKDMFHDFLQSAGPKHARSALKELFKVLDTKVEDRDPYIDEDLAAFPYINGGLFADENIIIPTFNDEIVELLLTHASADFDWSGISPTIFGAVFESTLNPDTRRKGGMHYTSIENIHKVIDPLFLDGLKQEFEDIKQTKYLKTKNQKLNEFQDKLASLAFFDPACGSGNFLTESYISLRRLENEVILERYKEKSIVLNFVEGYSYIKVGINQFYGIEINDFAVTVAKTALWIAESQMLAETEQIVNDSIDFLPLKSYTNIIEANALRIKWEDVLPKDKCSYLMGNPPFRGYSLQSESQKNDILSVYVDEEGTTYSKAGKIDYVAGWYFKAAKYMYRTSIRTAFVSTNSITQGEQVADVWQPLYNRFGIHIDFAYRTFRWNSESNSQAHVHCVIIGFSHGISPKEKILISGELIQHVDNINPYLVNAPNVFIESRRRPLSNVSEMVYGNKPTDGGFLFLTPEDRDEALTKEPEIGPYIKQIYGANEYINNKLRFCLWLLGAPPSLVKKSKFIKNRVRKVQEFRLASTKQATKESAKTPTLFQEIRQPTSNYIIIPRHSSENRRYVPIGFITPEVIVNDAVQIIPNATIYDFGILTSNVHMAWMRAVAGRLKSDYRYSKDVVYNNFPWPAPTEAQKDMIEKTAQLILDARKLYPNESLADLYDPVGMTQATELLNAHRANDKAVMTAYGFPVKGFTEADCVAELMKLYQKLVFQ
ncbi:DNA methyltransferase [Selenomonas sp. AE3005]|uniref:DNA methyltransferase n=1 Tax=Selenomonas sp. AE3005 TaxID=1485543 RepID=UPI000AB19275|nr:DNA methyltransferase [Selenomonas sp. AE3005]